MLKYVIAVLVSIPLCLAQGINYATREIDVSSSRPIQAAPFSYYGANQCDRDGNMYFHAVDSDFRQGQIFRLSSDGVLEIFSELPASLLILTRRVLIVFGLRATARCLFLRALQRKSTSSPLITMGW